MTKAAIGELKGLTGRAQAIADTQKLNAQEIVLEEELLKVKEKAETRVKKTKDGLFAGGSSDTPKLMSEGEVFDFIRKDQILAAPDIDVNLNILKESYLKMKELTSGINSMSPKDLPSTRLPKTESTQKNEVTETKVQKIEGSGTVNINVNITSSGNLADTLINDRRFKNDLEKEILYVIKNKDVLMVKKP